VPVVGDKVTIQPPGTNTPVQVLVALLRPLVAEVMLAIGQCCSCCGAVITPG